jgi:hypothetical protein
MVKDLNLVGYQYNIAAAVFFLLYAAAEIPRWEIAGCPVECANRGYILRTVTLLSSSCGPQYGVCAFFSDVMRPKLNLSCSPVNYGRVGHRNDPYVSREIL